jgi:bacterioferritin
VAFFQTEVADELQLGQFLADKVAALGGEPAVTPKPVVVTRDAREMLEQIYQVETATIAQHRERLEQAEAAGDIGLKVRLEEIVADETNHKEEVEKILATWQ